VRDGLAERAFGRPLRVDVNPLVIAGRVGEEVDVILADRHPIALSDAFTLDRGEVGD
jgi:hypothetical protein